MTAIEFTVNGREHRYAGEAARPLLWYLRQHLGLTGTKFGCGIGACGACTVHLNGRAVRACVVPMGGLRPGDRVRTIEGLARGNVLHPVQRAWLETDVSQCGYCQPGQIMAAVHLLAVHPDPTDDDIDREITNLCRCGTYNRIRRAIHLAARLLRQRATP